MYNKFLFIGLGGSGGKTLRFLKDQIRRWMKDHGLEGDNIPSGWQFLHIDVPSQPDGNEINHLVPQLAGDEYLGLVNAGVTFDDVQAELDAAANLDAATDRREELRTWRVEPTGLKIPIVAGAGQYRAVGSSIGKLHVDRIKKRIEEKNNRLNEGQAVQDLGLAYAKAQGTSGAPRSAGEVQTNIFVISSLAGGTGAGLFNTVCDLIRGMDVASARGIFGIIYTSEVFNVLPAATKAGVHGNGLAAVCELLNGFWWNGNPRSDDENFVKPIEDQFLKAGGVGGTLNNSGPSYPFLVGLQNSQGVNFGTSDSLFEGVGRALLSWVTDEEVSGTFISYTIANFKSAATKNIRGRALVDVGEDEAIGLPPFSALGFARVSLGTDHFERFAVDRVVRDCYRHLVEYQSNSPDAKQAAKSISKDDPAAIVGRLAQNYGAWFRNELQVEEINFKAGPLRCELWPTTGSIDRLGGACKEYQEQVEQDASLDVGGIRLASGWRDLIDPAVEDRFAAFEQQIRNELNEKSGEWVEAVQQRALETVRTAISKYGLRVAARLCSDTATFLRTTVVNNIRSDVIPVLRQWADSWRDEASQELAGASGKLRHSDTRIRSYVELAIHYRAFAADALVAERAAELAREAADRLFDPLTKAIDDAFRRLRVDEDPASFQFGPPANEFSLIEKHEYKDLFDRLLRQTFGSEDYASLREAVIGCNEVDPESGHTFVELARGWSPSARWSDSPANIDITVGSTRELLANSATAWLNNGGGPFGELLGLSLRSALDTGADSGTAITAAERQVYQKRFMACLDAAIATAAPLVDINPALAGLVGNEPGKAKVWHFSKLPFGPGPDGAHPMEKKVSSELAPIIGAEQVGKLMKPDQHARHIDVASQLAAPQSILALKSVLAPIAQDWDQQKSIGEVAIQQFWQHRRAQYLQRFVPCPQAHLRCLVRGWFTSQMLGLLDPAGTNGLIQIARHGKHPATFPNPFLSKIQRVENRYDRLGPVLESLGLAYVEAAASGSLEPLEAYVSLLELGKSGDGGILHYESINQRLATWIESGQPVEGALTGLKPARLGNLSDTATWQDRATAIAEVLDDVYRGYRDEYEKLRKDWEIKPGLRSRAPLWTGLWPLLGDEVERLSQAVKAHFPDDGLG